MTLRRLLLVLLAGVLLGANVAGGAPEPVGPPEFSPTGEAKDVRQATARFAEPMVALGDPRDSEIPFDVDCPVPGSPRWVDSRTWAWDFVDPLPGGVECRFTLRSGITTLDGAPVEGGASFAFSTGGPHVVSSDPYAGSKVEEDAAFLLRLDAPTDPDSIEAHAYFAVAGVGERVGVRLIEGEKKDAVLATLPPASRTGDIVLLQARQTFPPGAKVELVWGKGIEATTGVARRDDQKLAFQVRKAFHATFQCQRERAQGPCVPLGRVRLRFSEPVSWDVARRAEIVDPGSDFRHAAEDWLGDGETTTGIRFDGGLPPSKRLELRLPDDLEDESGRELDNAARFPLSFETGPFPPLAKFAARFGILEQKADPALPVTVRGLGPELHAAALATTKTLDGRVEHVDAAEVDDVLPWLRRVRGARRDRSVFDAAPPSAGDARELRLPIPGEPGETQVLGVPLPRPGLYVVEIESEPLGRVLLARPEPMYVSAAALVTNLAVHLKQGRESSLVWVTTLDAAEPAEGAEVRVHDCTGAELARGTTDRRGLARFDSLPATEELPTCRVTTDDGSDPWREYGGGNQPLDGIDRGLFVTARRGDDLSFVFSSWDDGIEPWRFGIYGGWGRPAALHTIFGRTLLRAGETVHMKHVVRLPSEAGFALPAPDALPGLVSIRHVGSDTQVDLPIEWAPDGTALTTWAIPASAKLGEYEVYLAPAPEPADTAGPSPTETAGPEAEDGLEVYRSESPPLSGRSGSFRVEEFRVPLLHAVVKLPAEPQVAPKEIPVDVALRYLAGGGAGDTDVLLRSQLSPTSIESPRAFEELTFGNGPVRTGVERRPTFARDDEGAPAIHGREEIDLDAEGTARAWVSDLPPLEVPLELTAEVEYRDPSGETQTSAARVPLWPASRAVGLRVEDWVGSTGRIVVETGVIDPAGAPVAGASVVVKAFSRKSYTSRTRVVGGFYAYESVEETSFAHTICRGRTDAAGRFTCRRRPPLTGEVVLQASTVDDDGRTSAAHQSVWLSGDDDPWFRPSDTDRMELLPERTRWEPGESARLQVRMPFPRARALITLEREGVIEAWVKELSGSDPVVEVPITGNLAPNVYVSVLAVRGRVGRPRATALVDLGKPAFRLGFAELEVGWKEHELDVEVTTDRSVYRVRESASVSVRVRDADGGAPPAGSEIAIAAVDEGLLELVPNPSWNLLRAMMGERPQSVTTATAQMQVVGKRHYGRKAVPQGGGGGRKPTRELFDTLLLWKGRVALDPEGGARIDVPLGDALTSFRIVAVATGGVGRFGTGKTSIQTTQDLMIFSGLPPVVRNGDRLWSEFTVRNTTGRTVDVQLTARPDGLDAELPPLEARLDSGEARAFGWETTVPDRIGELVWEVEARDMHGEAADRLRVVQAVKRAVPVRTLQASLEPWTPPGPVDAPVARPAGALPGEGGVAVTLAGSLADGLTGVREWMRDYSYTCLEQLVSRAVALDDDALWSSVVQSLPSYVDDEGLLKFFPTMDVGSPVLTAYVLEISQRAGRPLPAELRERMQTALVRFVEGRTPRSADDGAGSLALRKLAALSALAETGSAREDLATSITVEPELWPNASVLAWWNVLLGLPDLPGRAEKLDEVARVVRGRLFAQGSSLSLSESGAGSPWWLLANDETDALRLVLLALESGAWSEDLPKLVRGALGLQRKGAWSTTVANAWGTLAVTRFTEQFEPEPVGGSTVASLAGHAQQVDWVRHPEGGTLTFPWPSRPSDLSVQHHGPGRPWILARARAAVPLREPLESGFRIRRTVTPVAPRADGPLRVGDVLEVRLDVDAAAGHGWVVVEDPVPAGTSHLGRGFATDPKVTGGGSADEGDAIDVEPSFVERGFESYRAYFERLPPGSFTLRYRIRLSQAGTFHLPPTHVEALYTPEAFADLPREPVVVER